MRSQKVKMCCCCFTIITGTYVLLWITTVFWGGFAVVGILRPGKVVNTTDIASSETNSSSVGHLGQRSIGKKTFDHSGSIILAGTGALGIYAVSMNKPLLLMPYLIYRVIFTSITVVLVTVFVLLMLLISQFSWSISEATTTATQFSTNFLSTEYQDDVMNISKNYIRPVLVDTDIVIAVVILLALVFLGTEIHFVITVCRCYKMLGVSRSPEDGATDETIELQHQPSAPIHLGKWHHMNQATDVLI